MHGTTVLHSRQIKAARALLDWSQEDLASAAHLSIATIRKLETGTISPRYSTTSVIRQAIEGAGLEFIAHDGVRRRPDDMTVFQGPGSIPDFMEDVEKTIRKKPEDDIIVLASENIFAEDGDPYGELDRIATIYGHSVKCLLTEFLQPPRSAPRFEFRSISRQYVDPIPFWIYGDKYAVIASFNGPPKFVVIHSPAVAQSSRRHFLSMWEKGAAIALVEK